MARPSDLLAAARAGRRIARADQIATLMSGLECDAFARGAELIDQPLTATERAVLDKRRAHLAGRVRP